VDNIRMDLVEVGWDGMGWDDVDRIDLVQDKDR
jgi:hypothetical protein